MSQDPVTCYVLVCRVCSPDLTDDPVSVSFATPAERGQWAMRHKQQTGHDSWLVLDQQPGMNLGIIGEQEDPSMHYTDDPYYQDWINELLELTPDSWGVDESGEWNALRYVTHLVEEVKRLGGCLYDGCGWSIDEPCDHGYLSAPIRDFGADSPGPAFF